MKIALKSPLSIRLAFELDNRRNAAPADLGIMSHLEQDPLGGRAVFAKVGGGGRGEVTVLVAISE